MKRLKKYLFIPLLFIVPNLNAQLSEFMVQSYFNQDNSNSIDNSVDSFLKFKEYYINSIYFDRQAKGCYNIYELAKSAGLNIVVSDYWSRRDSLYTDRSSDTTILYELSKSNYSVNGYCITDEPDRPGVPPYGQTNLLEYIPPYTHLIKNYNPSLLRYANLFYFYPWDELYTEGYIQRYIDTAKPNLLSFDCYPFYRDDINTFYKTLYSIGMKSVSNSIPFIYVLTTLRDSIENDNLNHFNNPEALSLAEIRYCINAALAYGAKGISYWPCFDHLYGSYINFDAGVKESLIALHNKLIDHSEVLLSLNFASAYHKSFSSTIRPPEQNIQESIHDFCKWDGISNDKYAQEIFFDPNYCVWDEYSGNVPEEIAITFMTNSSGKVYFWVFNKSISEEQHIVLGSTNDDFIDVLNDNIILNYIDGGPSILLKPGEAKLFTYATSSNNPKNYAITNKDYNEAPSIIRDGIHLYPFELANQITLGSNVNFNSISTKSFMANQIIVNPGVSIPRGSTVRLSSYKNSNSISSSLLRSAKFQNDEQPPKESILKPIIYPNPTHDFFKVKTRLSQNDELEIRVYNNIGRLVKVEKSKNEETSISLQNEAKGVYYVHITISNQAFNFKVIKLQGYHKGL